MPVWILFLLLCLLWLAYLALPFIRREDEPGDRRQRLVEEKLRYLFALRDAELDFRTGKITEADYLSVRDRLEIKAAEVLKALDQHGAGSPEEKVEATLKQLRERRA